MLARTTKLTHAVSESHMSSSDMRSDRGYLSLPYMNMKGPSSMSTCPAGPVIGRIRSYWFPCTRLTKSTDKSLRDMSGSKS
jgi:hypothetical protein